MKRIGLLIVLLLCALLFAGGTWLVLIALSTAIEEG